MEKKKMSLAGKMLVSMGLGLGCGIVFLFLRESLVNGGNAELWAKINSLLFADITAAGNESAIGILYIVGQVFVRLLQVVIVPMVFCSITIAIANMNDLNKLGRISKKTLTAFLISSVSALLLAAVVGYIVYSMGAFTVGNLGDMAASTGSTGTNPLLVLLNAFPTNLTSTLSNNSSVLALVVCAVILGLAMGKLGDEVSTLKKLMEEVSALINVILGVIVQKLAPIGVFCLLARTFAVYGINYLIPAMTYVVTTVILLFLFLFVGYAVLVKVFGHVNPIPFIKKIAKVAIFGFSTSSSAATLPLNTKTCQEDLGVAPEIASFVLPLGMTINMDGTAIMQVVATIFVASCGGYKVTLGSLLVVALLALVASIGTPAAPGAGAVILFTILTGMGYGNDTALLAYSLILAINRPIEMLVTSLNVVGDAAAAVIVAKSEGVLDEETYNAE